MLLTSLLLGMHCRARCQRSSHAALPLPHATPDPEGSPKEGASFSAGDGTAGSAAQAPPDLAATSPKLPGGEESEPALAKPDREGDLVGFAGVAFATDPEADEAAEASRVQAEEARRLRHLPRADTMYAPLEYRTQWRSKVCAMQGGMLRILPYKECRAGVCAGKQSRVAVNGPASLVTGPSPTRRDPCVAC